MINLLQPVNKCMIHSCLVDVCGHQIPYRTVMCWLLDFWFPSSYSTGWHQSFARKTVSTKNKLKKAFSMTYISASIFFLLHTVQFSETDFSGNIMFSISKCSKHCEMPCLPCSSVLGLSRLQQIYIVVKNKKIDVGRKTTCES